MKADVPLRLALAANAIFSISSALVMIVHPSRVGEWLGIDAPLTLQLIGAGLTAFAAELICQATRRRMTTWRALLAGGADFSWVIGSLALVLVLPEFLAPSGRVLVLWVAGAVFLFGAWQLWAAGRAHRNGGNGVYRHCIIVETNAPAEKLWRIVGDIGSIKNYMPSLTRSMIVHGQAPGTGVIRVCEDRAGMRGAEECTEFNPGRSFAVRFLSEGPNFPFPATAMRGGWEVTPSQDGSGVMAWWELTPKSRLLAPIILPLLAFQVDRDFPHIIRRMTVAALGTNGEVQRSSSGGVVAKRSPSSC